MDEEWAWINLQAEPKEIDPDLILDPSMYGRYRFLQIQRWQQEPRFFLARDIAGMAGQDVIAERRKLLRKEGTDVRRGDDSGEGQEED